MKYLVWLLLVGSFSCAQKKSRVKIRDIDQIYSQNVGKEIHIEDRFPDSIVKEISIDCGCVHDLSLNDSCFTNFFTFFHNGSLKEKGCQGFYQDIGTSVGDWEEFDSLGNLKTITHYHNDIFGKDYILTKFFKNNKLVKEEKTNNYILYENEKEILN